MPISAELLTEDNEIPVNPDFAGKKADYQLFDLGDGLVAKVIGDKTAPHIARRFVEGNSQQVLTVYYPFDLKTGTVICSEIDATVTPEILNRAREMFGYQAI